MIKILPSNTRQSGNNIAAVVVVGGGRGGSFRSSCDKGPSTLESLIIFIFFVSLVISLIRASDT